MEHLKKYILHFIAAVLVFVSIIILISWSLASYTRKDAVYKTPSLVGLSLNNAIDAVRIGNYNYVILDSSRYYPKIHPNQIIKQYPEAGSPIKKGRKIYLKVNKSKYEKISLPIIDFENEKVENLEKKLIMLGFIIGNKTYEPHIGDGVVLGISSDGKPLKSGQTISKASVIDIRVGRSNSFNQTPQTKHQSETDYSSSNKNLHEDF